MGQRKEPRLGKNRAKNAVTLLTRKAHHMISHARDDQRIRHKMLWLNKDPEFYAMEAMRENVAMESVE